MKEHTFDVKYLNRDFICKNFSLDDLKKIMSEDDYEMFEKNWALVETSWPIESEFELIGDYGSKFYPLLITYGIMCLK